MLEEIREELKYRMKIYDYDLSKLEKDLDKNRVDKLD